MHLALVLNSQTWNISPADTFSSKIVSFHKSCFSCLKSPLKKFQKGVKRICCCYYCKAAIYSNNDEECPQSDESTENEEDPGHYTGSNVSKPPTKWEAPSIKHPPAQNDANKIKNWSKTDLSWSLHKLHHGNKYAYVATKSQKGNKLFYGNVYYSVPIISVPILLRHDNRASISSFRF